MFSVEEGFAPNRYLCTFNDDVEDDSGTVEVGTVFEGGPS